MFKKIILLIINSKKVVIIKILKPVSSRDTP